MDAHLNLGDRAGRDAKAALRAALADTIRAILARNRPKYRILRRLAPVASSAPSIGRLWAIGDIDQFAERMAELSALITPPA